MIALPVKLDKKDTAVSPLFGKSKWFAFVDDNGKIEFWKNDLLNGREIVDFFVQKGVEKVVFQSMGGSPLTQLKDRGIGCFYAGDGRVLMEDAIRACNEQNLLHVTTENMNEYMEESKLIRKSLGKGLGLGQKNGHGNNS